MALITDIIGTLTYVVAVHATALFLFALVVVGLAHHVRIGIDVAHDLYLFVRHLIHRTTDTHH